MALQLNVQSVPLTQGIDTKPDPKQLTLGKLVSIRNLVFDEVGDLSPRNGYAALTQSILNTGTISTGVTLATLNSSLVLATGSTLYSYAESLTKWAPKGGKLAVSLSTYPVTGTAQSATMQDSAIHSGGAAIYTWVSSSTSTAGYSVVDTTSQATVVENGFSVVTPNTTLAKPCVVGANSSFSVFTQNAGRINGYVVPLADPANPTGGTGVVDISSGSAPFDACTGGIYAYLFYTSISGDLAISRIDTSLTEVNAVTLTGNTGTSLTCWYDTTNNYVWLMWYTGTIVKYAVYTSALVLVRAATTVATDSGVTRLTGALTSGTTSTVYYEKTATSNADNIIYAYSITAAGVSTSISNLRSVGLAGKAFTYSGTTYAIAVHDSSLQSTYFLVKPLGFNSYAQGTVVGKLAPLLAGGTPTLKSLGSTYATATGKYAFCYLLQTNPTTLAGVVQSTKTLQAAIFDFTSNPRKITLANTLHLTGAILTGYDSGTSTEHGFNLFPEGGSSFIPLTFGGLAIGGNYSYKFTYEWIDEFGQTHRSAPSTGLPVSVGTTITSPIVGSASNGSSTTNIIIALHGGVDPTRYVTPDVEIFDSFSIFTNPTTITSISSTNAVNITPADAGGVFSVPVSFDNYKPFSYTVSTGNGTSLITSRPTVLHANATTTTGSARIFAAVTSGLVVGQAITDNVSAIPGGTTITAFSYTNGGAYITLSANVGTGYDNAIVNITHATGWPIALWLHVGQAVTGSGIPADTTITAVTDTTASTATITVSKEIPAVASGTFYVTDAYNNKLTLPTLRVTEKGRVAQPVQIAVWRTASNGTSYYKVGYAVNDTTVDSVIFYDDTDDSVLVGNTPLYTNGGEVENISAPASDFVTSYKNRVILLPSEDGYAWWYSKQVVEGTPVEFSDLFKQGIDQRGGYLTGASPLDDKLIFFKQKDLFYVAGDGPAPSGANNDFSYPQVITSPCGCTEPKSIITIPTGIIFKSAKGFYLLDRGLNVSYIGAQVEDYNSYTVTSAVLTATGTQVRFTMSGSLVLVYDYYVGQWSVFDSVTAVDATIYGNTYAYLTSAGLVLEETPGVYSDNGAVIVPSFQTGWISFEKVQNYQRLWSTLLLGQYYSPHTLTMSYAHDFDSTVTQTATVTLTSALTPYELNFPPIKQKCAAVQLTFTLTPASIAGQGASFSNLTFEFGIKKGANKQAASRTYGGSAT